MKNRAVLKFFLIYFGFTIVSNFVHSITPAFLQMIQAPSYINGVALSNQLIRPRNRVQNTVEEMCEDYDQLCRTLTSD